MPIAQTSILGVDSVCPIRTSGGIYLSDPTLLFSPLLPRVDPKTPKSTIFNSTSKGLVKDDFLLLYLSGELSLIILAGLG